MAVSSTNLIQGPAVVYFGIFGAVEPATVSAVPGVGWTDVGGTKDGVELSIEDEYAVLDVDQIIYEIARRRTKRVLSIKTTLAEATLENLAQAVNNTAPVAKKLVLDDGLAAFSPAYGAIMLDGIGPNGVKRRVILRKTLATDSVGLGYKKDAQTLIPVTWTGHWISPSIAPLSVEDA